MSFNYGCSPNDPAELIIRSWQKLMAYLLCIIVQIFSAIIFPSVISHLFELHASESTNQPRTLQIKKYTLATKLKKHFEVIFLEYEIGVSFEILYPHGAVLISSI